MKKPILLSFFFLLFLCIGCSGKVQISGKVTYTDGTPLFPGKVCFSTEKNTYYGRLNREGYYTVGEFEDGEGIVPGKYSVWVAETGHAKEIIKNGKATGIYEDVELVSAKYTAPNPDGLKFEHKRGGAKTFDFTVERP